MSERTEQTRSEQSESPRTIACPRYAGRPPTGGPDHLIRAQLLGRHDEARAHAEQALHLARAHSFRVVEGQALTALSETAASEEAHPTAVKLAEEALAIQRETGHRLGEARTLMTLARTHRKTDNTAAELRRRQAREIFSDIGMPAKEYRDLDR